MPLFRLLFFLLGTSLATAAPLRVLCLGDSITQGLTVAGSNGGYSWRYPLWKSMIEAGYNVDFIGSINYGNGTEQVIPPPVNGIPFDRDHEGHAAWRADEILNGKPGELPGVGGAGSGRLSQWLATYRADIAVIMIGTNDCILRQNGDSTAAEILAITRAIQADSPGASVFICSLPNTTISVAQASLIQTNANLFANVDSLWSTASSRVKFVNCTTGYNATTHNYDGLHPNASGEAFIASRIFEQFQEVVGPPNFAAWIAGFPGIPAAMRGADADPDGDGFTNFQHFIFGGSPESGSDAQPPLKLISEAGGDRIFTLVRRRHSALRLRFSTSTDLETWNSTPPKVTGRRRIGSYDELTLLLPAPEAEPLPNAFYRIEVATP